MAGVNQSLDLNFNLYLLSLFNGACSYNIEFILSKKDSKDTSNWTTSDQSLSSKVNCKVYLNTF